VTESDGRQLTIGDGIQAMVSLTFEYFGRRRRWVTARFSPCEAMSVRSEFLPPLGNGFAAGSAPLSNGFAVDFGLHLAGSRRVSALARRVRGFAVGFGPHRARITSDCEIRPSHGQCLHIPASGVTRLCCKSRGSVTQRQWLFTFAELEGKRVRCKS
jgi:hypothetical protein